MRLILIFIRMGLAVALSTSTACARAAPTGGRASVVASFFPLAEAAREVGGARVEVTNLTPVGAEPHDVELSPDQVDLILDADAVIYLGGGFQPAVEELAARREASSLDVLAGHGRARSDPHVWLDPLAMRDIAEEISGLLADVDPGGAEGYEARADRYGRRLLELHGRMEAGLSRCERRTIVVAHAAFAHMASRYRLRQVAISGLSPEAEPDPARLDDLVELVEAQGVSTVFSERLASAEIASTLAREAGVRTAVLDPIEGLTSEQDRRGEGYFSLMESNLRTLRKALDCR